MYSAVNTRRKTLSNASAAVNAPTENPNTSGAKLRPPPGYTTKGCVVDMRAKIVAENKLCVTSFR